MDINQDLKEQLALGFEKQRHRPDEDLRVPLMEADFCHDVCGSLCAYFKVDYITSLMNSSGGMVKTYLKGTLKGYPSTHRPRLDSMYMTEYEIDFLLEEIEYWIKNKRWRECINEDDDV